MTLSEKVVLLYENGIDGIKTIAKICNVSHNTVRRILITAGLWSSEKSNEINSLYDAGCSLDEIATITGMQHKHVLEYLPYPKGPRAEWPTTRNALRIRECRERKNNSGTK